MVDTSRTHFLRAVKEIASKKFGKADPDWVEFYVSYWSGTEERNNHLFESFQSRVEVALGGKRVLDVGCGTAGLSHLVTEEGGIFIGLDYSPEITSLAQAYLQDLSAEKAWLIRASGHLLPLQDQCVDYVVAFDVIEHLEGGWEWQLLFLQESERVLRDDGLLFLTTPNWLYPWEGHTLLLFPHYLPTPLADIYVRWRKPAFLEEYHSFGQLVLLTPWGLQRLVQNSGLALLHDLPWCMDIEDYSGRKRRVFSILRRLGLHWWPTNGFWCVLCKRKSLEALRQRRSKHWLKA